MYPVVEWKNNKVVMINQRLLPFKEKFVVHDNYQEVAESIKNMIIRGAPAIGVSAAMGIALGVIHIKKNSVEEEFKEIISTTACWVL